eukprot:360131-Rhodomonas_salina.1
MKLPSALALTSVRACACSGKLAWVCCESCEICASRASSFFLAASSSENSGFEMRGMYSVLIVGEGLGFEVVDMFGLMPNFSSCSSSALWLSFAIAERERMMRSSNRDCIIMRSEIPGNKGDCSESTAKGWRLEIQLEDRRTESNGRTLCAFPNLSNLAGTTSSCTTS